jgi:hypothetical protein
MDSRSVMPPMSTTSLPSSSAPIEAAAPSVKPPILASDILREEVAPLAPASSAMRRWLLALAAGFGLLGGAYFEGLLPTAELAVTASLVTAAAAVLAWLVPYTARACLAVLAGLMPLALGAALKGPLALLGSEGDLPAGASLVLVTLLPAALFFRAQYRAFGAARAFLVVALLLAIPGVFFLGQGAVTGGTPVLLRAADVLVVTAVLTSFAGFLGPETTGACTIWGAALLVLAPARQLVATSLGEASGSKLAVAAAEAVGVALAATVVSVGLYQLLAAALARRARMVDVHRIVGPSAEGQ